MNRCLSIASNRHHGCAWIALHLFLLLGMDGHAQWEGVWIAGTRDPLAQSALIFHPQEELFPLNLGVDTYIQGSMAPFFDAEQPDLILAGDFSGKALQRVCFLHPDQYQIKATFEPSEWLPSFAKNGQLVIAANPPFLLVANHQTHQGQLAVFEYLGDAVWTTRWQVQLPQMSAHTLCTWRENTLVLGPFFFQGQWQLWQYEPANATWETEPLRMELILEADFNGTWTFASQFLGLSLDGRSMVLLSKTGQLIQEVNTQLPSGLQNGRLAIFDQNTALVLAETGDPHSLSLFRLDLRPEQRGEVLEQQQLPYCDRFQIWTNAQSSSVVIDPPPQVGLHLSMPQNQFLTRQAPILVRGTAGETVLQVYVNGQLATLNEGTFFTELDCPEGPLTIEAIGTTSGTTLEDRVSGLVDRSPPVIEILEPLPNEPVYPDSYIRGRVTDSYDDRPRLEINGESVLLSQNEFSFQLEQLGSGPHRFTLEATDHLNNRMIRELDLEVLPPVEIQIQLPQQTLRGASCQGSVGLSYGVATLILPDGNSQILQAGETPISWPVDGWESANQLEFQVQVIYWPDVSASVDLVDPPLVFSELFPLQEGTTGAQEMLIGGRVSPEFSRVRLATGQPLEISASGAFQTTVPLVHGLNIFTFQGELVESQVESPLIELFADHRPPQLQWELPATHQRGATLTVSLSGEDETMLDQIALSESGQILQQWQPQTQNWSSQFSRSVDYLEPMTSLIWSFQATDQVGNQSRLDYSIDLVDPPVSLMITEPVSGLRTNQPGVLIRGQVSPFAATVTVDPATAVERDGEDFSGLLSLQEGDNAFHLVARLGQSIDEADLSVYADWTPPEMTVDVPSQAQQGEMFALQWEMTDRSSLTTTEVLLDGAILSQNASGSLTLPVPIQMGLLEWQFVFRAVDDLGNQSQESFVVTLLPISLTLQISQPSPGQWFNDQSLMISGTVSQPHADLSVILFGQSYPLENNDGFWQFSLALPMEGENLFDFSAQLHGYSAHQPLILFRDSEPPEVAYTGDSSVIKGQVARLSATADDAVEVATLSLSVEDGPFWQVNRETLSEEWLVPLDDPRNEVNIQVRAEDQVGNSTPLQRTLTLLSPRIHLELVTPQTGQIFPQTPVLFQGTVHPPDAQVSVEGQLVTNIQGAWSYSLDVSDGNHEVLVLAEKPPLDPEQLQISISVDTVGPQWEISGQPYLVRGQSHQLALSGTDQTGIKSIDITSSLGNHLSMVLDPSPITLQQPMVVVVPKLFAANELVFALSSLDVLDHSGIQNLAMPVLDPDQIPRVSIVVENPVNGEILGSAQQILSGYVIPSYAQLRLQGQPLDLALDGSFSVPVSLRSGVNRLWFDAEAAEHLPKSVHHTLVLDDQGPEIAVLSPEEEQVLHELLAEISGFVTDQYDPEPRCWVDGDPIHLERSFFKNSEFPLVEGRQTIPFTAEDRFGNRTEVVLSVEVVLPEMAMTLNAPAFLRSGNQGDIVVSAQDTTLCQKLILMVNGEQVAANDGQSDLHFSLTAEDSFDQYNLKAEGVFMGGLYNQRQAVILVQHPLFVKGRVLSHESSTPLDHQTVTLQTHEEMIQVITDEQGMFQTTINGGPVVASIEKEGFLPVKHHLLPASRLLRIPDIRLVGVESLESPHQWDTTLGQSTVSCVLLEQPSAGFSQTSVPFQALPCRLPLGWSPLMALDLQGLDAPNQLMIQGELPPSLTSQQTMYWATITEDGWQIRQEWSVGEAPSMVLNVTTNGSYALLMPDQSILGSLPLPFQLPPYQVATLTKERQGVASVNPESVTIEADPLTVFSFKGTFDVSVPSGTLVQADVEERHALFLNGSLQETYDCDLALFRPFPWESGGLSSVISGQIPIQARIPIDPTRTEKAQLWVTAKPLLNDRGNLLGQENGLLEGLQVIYHPEDHQIIGNLQLVHGEDPESWGQSRCLMVLQQWLAQPLSHTPQILMDQGFVDMNLPDDYLQTGQLILLHEVGNRWATLGPLWLNDGLYRLTEPMDESVEDALRGSGRFAVLALLDQVVPVSGQLSRVDGNSNSFSHILVTNSQSPWLATVSETGYFLAFLLPLPDPNAMASLQAWEASSQWSATRQLPQVNLGQPLYHQDLLLGPPDFRVLEMTPRCGATHVPSPLTISLTFSTQLPASVTEGSPWVELVDENESPVPCALRLNISRDILSLVPQRALAPGHSYILRCSEQLTDDFGSPLGAAWQCFFSMAESEPSPDLNLKSFHLKWDGQSLSLHAPNSAYPQRTRLRLTNTRTLLSETMTLMDQSLPRPLDGQLGDTFALEATTPDGRQWSHTVSLVQLQDGQFIPGTHPFELQLDEGLTLVIDQWLGNGLETYQVTLLQESQQQELLEQAAFTMDPNWLAALKTIHLENTSGRPVAAFEGGLRFTVQESQLGEAAILATANIIPGVFAPQSPESPGTMGQHMVTQIQDIHHYSEGTVFNKHGKRVLQQKSGLVQLMAEITVGRSILEQSIYLTNLLYAENCGAVSVFAKVYSDQDPNGALQRDPVTPALWHQSLPGGTEPVPGAFLYRKEGVGYSLVARADETGMATAHWMGCEVDDPLVLVDPQTLLPHPVRNGPFATNIIRDHLGFPIAINQQFNGHIHLQDVETGEPPLSVSYQWQVWEFQSEQSERNHLETERLQQTNQFFSVDSTFLKCLVTANQPLSSVALTCPAMPSVDGEFLNLQEVLFTYPAGLFSQETLLPFQLSVIPEEGEVWQTQGSLLALSDAGSISSKPGLPPNVLSSYPMPEQVQVGINVVPLFRFSEPVDATRLQGVRWLDQSETPVPFRLVDHHFRELEEAGSGWLPEIMLLPKEALHFGEWYSLSVSDCWDDQGEIQIQPFFSRFKTQSYCLQAIPGAAEPTLLSWANTPQIAFYRNLGVLATAVQKGDRQNMRLQVFSNQQNGIPEFLHHQDVTIGAGFLHLPMIELFPPRQCLAGEVNASGLESDRDSDLLLADLPDETIALLSYWIFSNLASNQQIILLRYRQGIWETLLEYEMPGFFINASDVFGPYWFFSTQAADRGAILVHDIRDMVDQDKGVVALNQKYQSQVLTHSQYIDALTQCGRVAFFPEPSASLDVKTFLMEQQGQLFPSFDHANWRYPRVVRFDPGEQPALMGSLPSGSLPPHDSRLWFRCDYDAQTPFHHEVGVCQSVLTQISGIWKKRPVHVFAFNEGGLATLNGLVANMDDPQLSAQTQVPMHTRLDLSEPLIELAVDLKEPFAAVATPTTLAILDLQSWMSQTGNEPPGFDNPAWIMVLPKTGINGLSCHDGNVLIHTASGLEELEIKPKSYRRIGWEILDLTAWTSGDPGRFQPKMSYAHHVVLNAQLQKVDQETRLMSEMGSFAVEVLEPTLVRIRWKNAEDAILLSEERLLNQAGLTYFAPQFLPQWLQQHLDDFLHEGVAGFAIEVDLLEPTSERPLHHGNYPFYLANLTPDGQYQDDLRILDTLDVWTGSPHLLTSWLSYSSRDPRLSLDLRTVYSRDDAFHQGAFGTGWLSGNWVYADMGLFWDIENEIDLGLKPHGIQKGRDRLRLEQPGLWQVLVECQASGRQAQVRNALNSKMILVDDVWHLNLEETADLTLNTRTHLPDLKSLYLSWNTQWESRGKLPGDVRYPLLRVPADQDRPGNRRVVVPIRSLQDLPFGNSYRYGTRSGLPGDHPDQITETVNDIGPVRQHQIVWQQESFGSRVQEIQTAQTRPSWQASYDSEGYLKTVSLVGVEGTRQHHFQWEAIPLLSPLGKFQPKRLVMWDQPEEALDSWQYETSGFAVTQHQTAFGSRSVTFDSEGLTVGSLGVSPSRTVLRPTEKSLPFGCTGFSIGAETFVLTWEMRARNGAEALLLKTSDWNQQNWNYDDRGRLTAHYRHGSGGFTYHYGNEGPFFAVPTLVVDPTGVRGTIDTNATKQVETRDGLSRIVHFSSSGSILRETDLRGFEVGADFSQHYQPHGRGYRSANGFLEETPYPGKQGQIAFSSHVFNSFGEAVWQQIQGVEDITESRDQLGRPRTGQALGGVTWVKNYAMASGQLEVTSEFNGVVNIQRFSADGWLLEEEQIAVEKEPLMAVYHYDVLGRLTDVLVNGQSQISRSDFFQQSDWPRTTEEPGLQRNTTYNAGWIPRISQLSVIVEGQEQQFPLQTDALGQVTETTMPAWGATNIVRDGWGRIIQVGTKPHLTIAYDGSRQTVENHHTGQVEITKFQDPWGWEQDREWVVGEETHKVILRTSAGPMNVGPSGVGQQVTQQADFGSFSASQSTSTLGTHLVTRLGNLQDHCTALNALGQGETYSGLLERTYHYDAQGFPDSVTMNGISANWSSDGQGRVTSATDARGKHYQLSYQEKTGTLMDQLTIDGQVHLDNEGHLATQTTSVLGRQQSQQVGWGTTTVTRTPHSGQKTPANKAGVYTATISKDPLSGLVTHLNDFEHNDWIVPWDETGHLNGTLSMAGDNYTVSTEVTSGNGTTISLEAGGVSHQMQMDPYGRLLRMNGPQQQWDIQRDILGRPTFISSNKGSWRYTYEQDRLVGIEGSDGSVSFDHFNASGQPQQITHSARGDWNLSYDENGTVRTARFIPADGREPVDATFSVFGDLQFTQKGNRAPIEVNITNAWGLPHTMTLEGNEVRVFGEKNELLVTLPEGRTLQFDESGALFRYTCPGFGPQEFLKDGLDRLSQETQINGALVRHTYEGLRLVQKQFELDNFSETRTFQYDDAHRLVEIKADGQTLWAGSYDPASRVASETNSIGVTTSYTYTPKGQIRQLLVENGPLLAYDYDTFGRITEVSTGGDLRVRFTYDEEHDTPLPTGIIWGEDQRVFTLRSEQGRLTEVTSEPFVLKLTYEDNDQLQQPLLSEVEKAGPDFSETWQLSYHIPEAGVPRLEKARIERSNGQIIEEEVGQNRIRSKHIRTLNGEPLLNSTLDADVSASNARVALMTDNTSQVTKAVHYDSGGSITAVDDELLLDFDLHRRLTSCTSVATALHKEHTYDVQDRRVETRTLGQNETRVYAYQGSRLIGLGLRDIGGQINWTHAIAYGPLGPCLVQCLVDAPNSFFIFTDHLGTPFAWVKVSTGEVTFTPYSPWGELLAQDPTRGPPAFPEGNIPASGISLPDFGDFPGNLPPLGLAGHLIEQDTGLVVMHHRTYHPRLGHFLTPDFRAPDIEDPATFTEPYAYAKGSPVMYFDPSGLDPKSLAFPKTESDFESHVNYVEALIQFLSYRGPVLTTRNATTTPYYNNFDPRSLLFTRITTVNELNYQMDILNYVVANGLGTESSQKNYQHLLNQLEGVAQEYKKKKDSWFLTNHEIVWKNLWETDGSVIGFRTGNMNPMNQWTAEISNLKNQEAGYEAFQLLESLVVATGSGLQGGSKIAPGIFPRPDQIRSLQAIRLMNEVKAEFALKSEGLSVNQIRKRNGPVLAGLMDKVTGEIFTMGNPKIPKEPRSLPEFLQQRVQFANNLDYLKTAGPGTHAEVHLLARALEVRPDAKLSDFMIYVINSGQKSSPIYFGQPVPRCPHCEFITNGVDFIPESLIYIQGGGK